MSWYSNVTGQLKVKQKEKLTAERTWMIRASLSPSLIFAMCKYCKHNVWYWIFIYFSKPLPLQTATATNRYLQPATRVQPHTIAPSRMRTIPASWCQLCRNLGAEILFAVSCQPVITLLIEIYPWSSSCCTLLGRVCHWEVLCIRTSVRRRGGNKAVR